MRKLYRLVSGEARPDNPDAPAMQEVWRKFGELYPDDLTPVYKSYDIAKALPPIRVPFTTPPKRSAFSHSCEKVLAMLMKNKPSRARHHTDGLSRKDVPNARFSPYIVPISAYVSQ